MHDCANDDVSTQGLYGTGWTNTFDAHAAFYNNNTILSIYNGDGARFDYSANGSGGWTAPAGMQGTTISSATDGYLWTNKSGVTYYFKAPDYGTLYGSQYAGWDGRLRAIYGRNSNNTITLNYTWDNNDASTSAHISNIVAAHSDGQSLNLAFADVNGCRVLTTVTRPDGQTVNYHYSGDQLSEVDRPGNGLTTSTTPVANQLPEAYDYSGGTNPRIAIYGPRILLSSWATGGNPQDGSAVFVDLNSLNQVVDTFDDGNVNFEPGDGTNTYLQPAMPVNRKVWRTDTYSYDSGVTGLIDTDGHQTQWVLDGSGRETLRQDLVASSWLKSTQTWDSNNDLTEVTDPRGNATDFAYDSNGNEIAMALPSITTSDGVLRPTSLYSYDAYHNVIAYCDPTYNATHGLSWGTSTPTAGECPSTLEATYYTYVYPSYEPYGELSTQETPLGYRWFYTYAPAASDYGLVSSIKGSPISADSGRTPTRIFTYDSRGNTLCVNNGVGTFAYEYDTLNRQTVSADPDDGSIIECGKTSSAYDTASHMFYNLDNSVSSSESPAEQSLGLSTTFSYDADGNLLSSTKHFGCTVTSCTAGVTHNWYDGDDRLVEVEQPHDKTDYYAFSWLTRYLYDISGGGTNNFDGGTAFKAYGNMFKTQEYLGADILSTAQTFGPTPPYPPVTWPSQYSSSALSWTDTKASSFDGADRETGSYYFAGSNSQSASEHKTTNYDQAGQYGLMTSVVGAAGNTDTLTYDADGQVSSETFTGDGGVTPNRVTTYDPNGRVATRQSSTFGAESFYYDLAGDLTVHLEPTGGGVTTPLKTEYQYYIDQLRNAVDVLPENGVSGGGLPQYSLFRYHYRQDDQISSQAVTFGSSTGTFQWTYTAGGRVLSALDPESTSGTSYTYNAAGLLASKTFPGASYSNVAYDAEGDVTGFALNGYGVPGVYPNPAATNIYNVRGELVYSAYSDITMCGHNVGNSDYFSLPHFAQQSANGVMVPVDIACTPAPVNGQTTPDGAPPIPTSFISSYRSAVVAVNQHKRNKFGTAINNVYTMDADGRQTGSNETYSQISQNGALECGSTSGSGQIAKAYDGEDHTVGLTWYDNFQLSSVTQTLCVNSLRTSYAWGPNGHPIITGESLVSSAGQAPVAIPAPSTLTTHTQHWDDDQLLLSTNASGAIDDIKIGTFAEWSSQRNTIAGNFGPGFTSLDRDLSGAVIASHVSNDSILESVPTAIAPIAQGASAPFGVLFEPRGDSIGDVYTTFQGVRTFDSAAEQWTTPDGYPGTIASPMSQKSYAWTNNNPYVYSDPSGYCTDDEWAAAKKAGTLAQTCGRKGGGADATFTFYLHGELGGVNFTHMYNSVNGMFNLATLFVPGGPEEAVASTAAERAAELAAELGSQRVGRVTIAVTETSEGVRIASSSERGNLRRSVQNALKAGEVPVKGLPNSHAEVTGITRALELGLTPTGVAASRPICQDCASFLSDRDIPILSPLRP